jgi:hypothetical protein
MFLTEEALRSGCFGSNPHTMSLNTLKTIGSFCSLSFAFSAFVGCSAEAPQSVVPNDDEAGWSALFDGVSLEGWRGYMGSEITDAWSVVDGVLVLRGGSTKDSYVNIISEQQYEDFDLRFEWKIEPGSNTGLMFHVQEGPKMPYLTGPEYQVLDNEGFRGGTGNPVSREEYTGSHYAIEAPLVDVMKPVGEWNQSRILVVGNKVEYWLNDALTAAYEMHSPAWNAQVAAAKFAKWKEFCTTTEGYFALQDHGHGAQFRNIKVKSL